MGKTKQQKVKDFLINNGVIIVMFILVIYFYCDLKYGCGEE